MSQMKTLIYEFDTKSPINEHFVHFETKSCISEHFVRVDTKSSINENIHFVPKQI